MGGEAVGLATAETEEDTSAFFPNFKNTHDKENGACAVVVPGGE